jgi:regulator of protease activity HflC (stomatin/prohibitin superfamily)
MNPTISSKLKFNLHWWVWVILGIIILWLFCVRVIGVGQVGIITRFGNINREVQSGITLKLPWPIEHLVKMNVQIQKEQQDASAATKDLQTVTTTLALNYHLTASTADDVYRSIGTSYKDRIVDPLLQEVVKSVTSQYNADQLISERPKVEAASLRELQTKLSQRGITVDNVSIVNFSFSSAFNDAIEQKQVAQQNAQKAQYELQSAQLQAQAQDVQAKTLTPEYLQLQAINKWDGKLPTYLGQNNAFNIPLSTGQ